MTKADNIHHVIEKTEIGNKREEYRPYGKREKIQSPVTITSSLERKFHNQYNEKSRVGELGIKINVTF